MIPTRTFGTWQRARSTSHALNAAARLGRNIAIIEYKSFLSFRLADTRVYTPQRRTQVACD
jgi:hypothetical protein